MYNKSPILHNYVFLHMEIVKIGPGIVMVIARYNASAGGYRDVSLRNLFMSTKHHDHNHRVGARNNIKSTNTPQSMTSEPPSLL